MVLSIVLEAGRHQLLASGYAGLSTRKVTQDAAVPVSQLNYHFGSKVVAPTDPVEHRATVRALAMTAQRVLAVWQEAKQLEAELRQLVTVMVPALLALPGIGPSQRCPAADQLVPSWPVPF